MEADENADRIVVIDRGRIVADGSGELVKRSAGGNLVSAEPPVDTPGPCGTGTGPDARTPSTLGP